MDNRSCHSNNMGSNRMVAEEPARATFQLSYPIHSGDETESNKSTPYFTPLEFFQSSFEFPSPTMEKTSHCKAYISAIEGSPTSPAAGTSDCDGFETPRAIEIQKPATPKKFAAVNSKVMPPSSPAVHRKLRRFSLYERRSCSPQHLLVKSTSVSVESGTSAATVDFVDDKENTKPNLADRGKEEGHAFVSLSGSNSPSALFEDTNSPNIMTVNESRVPYSPKLLTTINNLNLGGSPLGVISSAGYRSGNYFKFPEVDRVVQENTSDVKDEDPATHCDNHLRNRQNVRICAAGSPSDVPSTHHKARLKPDSARGDSVEKPERSKKPENSKPSASIKADTRKNRKNKNNLTIKISEVNTTHFPPHSPVSKPKTPTIKTTKEKALSLDSAGCETALCAAGLSENDISCVSCVEIDSPNLEKSATHSRQRITAATHEVVTTNRSTSLSQLSALSSTNSSSATYKSANTSQAVRRKILAAGSHERLSYHRKHNPFNPQSEGLAFRQSLKAVSSKKAASDCQANQSAAGMDHSVSGETLHPKHIQNSASHPQAAMTHSLRGSHKPNPLLHASNTNLKTLPEFLTLVEFTSPNAECRSPDYPYKQKSFDLPSASTATSALQHSTLRTKCTTSNSATNLLQRRGSNHSLTLNLHGSCSNLLGSYRSGLSVSNYSLGPAANSTTNLDVKSTCSHVSTTSKAQTLNAGHPDRRATPQGLKQSLFRRRGSNNSLTLQLSATSCGNLNTFASQSSHDSEGSKAMASTGVTRTTSFVTPINNAASGSASSKRGLLERRGSNQSLTLNMSASHKSVGGNDQHIHAAVTTEDVEQTRAHRDAAVNLDTNLLPESCSQSHQRKFFSSENLTKANTHFSDLNHAHKRNSQQVCFGSVLDLKPSGSASDQTPAGLTFHASLSGEQLDFQESTVCTCTGVRNITTRPLSPQTTSEEFKIYLANIQMLQNASNTLDQHDLIKLNYIFDNSYSTACGRLAASISLLTTVASRETAGAQNLLTTSEDSEISARYQQVVSEKLSSIELDDEEQKRMFRDLHKEFWDLPLNHQEKPMVFGSQSKNRYKTILPNENSRVVLESECKFLMRELNAAGSDDTLELTAGRRKQHVVSREAPYINANYIKGPDFTSRCYVATQGPLPNTIFDFWLMIYQNTQKHQKLYKEINDSSPQVDRKMAQYHQKIVMLTNFLENNRQKCSVYFPIELNEVFVASENQAAVVGSQQVEEFFHEFFVPSQGADSEMRNDVGTSECIEYTQTELPVHLHTVLPLNTNYFVIKNIGIIRKNGFSVRKLRVVYCINSSSAVHPTQEGSQPLLLRSFCCYHYWYPDWPDHRFPKDINTLLDMCLHILNLGKCEEEFLSFRSQEASPQLGRRAQHVDQYQQDIFNDVQPLPVIHCSAGIGRTGCLVAILNGVRQLRQSLAFSLVSMAASVSKQETNPVDFRLPVQYVQREEIIGSHTSTNSSFSLNTLLYVNYILSTSSCGGPQMEDNQADHTTREANVPGTCTQDSASSTMFDPQKLPELSKLPKVPDVYVDVLGIVCNLRLQRGGMVQNSEQYELIHRAVCLYLKRAFALKHF